MAVMGLLEKSVESEAKLDMSVKVNSRLERKITSNSLAYSPFSTLALISSKPPQTSMPGWTFSAYSLGGSLSQAVFDCHLK